MREFSLMTFENPNNKIRRKLNSILSRVHRLETMKITTYGALRPSEALVNLTHRNPYFSFGCFSLPFLCGNANYPHIRLQQVEGCEIHRNHAVCPGVGICSSSVYWEDATKGSYVMNIP